MNMTEYDWNAFKYMLMCYPMLSYCTIAFFKGDTSYKLTCPSTATHAIHWPCHLLRQPPRPFDLYCTPHNNGCATSRWKKNHQNPQWCFVEGQHIHLGCLWLGWFGVYSRPFGWQLLQATALWDNRRTWRHPGVEGPSGCLPQIWLPISRWKPDFEIQKGSNMSYLLWWYYTNLYKT